MIVTLLRAGLSAYDSDLEEIIAKERPNLSKEQRQQLINETLEGLLLRRLNNGMIKTHIRDAIITFDFDPLEIIGFSPFYRIKESLTVKQPNSLNDDLIIGVDWDTYKRLYGLR